MTAALDFAVVGCHPEPYALEPTLVFDLQIDAPEGVAIDSVLLRTQVRVEPERRRYSADEQRRLVELFGEPERWGDTAKPFLLTNVTTVVTRFTGHTRAPLPVACSYELEVGSTRYLHAVRDGHVPLVFMFSGSVFAYRGGRLAVEQLAWDRECRFELPAGAWHDLMDAYYPGSGWLRLRRSTLDRLAEIKAAGGHHSWDEAVDSLLHERLPRAEAPAGDGEEHRP